MENRTVKILAIDDIGDNLISIKALIGEAFPDAAVLTATEGMEGIAIAAAENPDVILLDILMPGMDGFEVCRILKDDSMLSSIPVVFMTAQKDDKDNRIRALESGAEAFLTKPIDECELKAQIRAMIKIKHSNLAKINEKERLELLIRERTRELNESYNATLKLLDDLKKENQIRKERETALALSEEKFRSIFENMVSGCSLDEIVYRDGKAADYRILDVNSSYEKITGYVKSEVTGKLATELFGDREIPFFDTFVRVSETGIPESFETDNTPNNKILQVTVTCPEKGKFSTIITDITERRESEDRIRSLLTEKELLLKEVHHRIKNNMNTIKGLVSLQLDVEENENVAASMLDIENRIQSMIILYEKLYCSDNYRVLSVKNYLDSLVPEIAGTFSNRKIINIHTVMDDFLLTVQTLAPLGIIVNELLTNIMKHAFTGRDSGNITINVKDKGERTEITIHDDGVGIPETIGFENSAGFGMKLVKMLTDQLDGNISIESDTGTRFVLEFAKDV